MSTLLQDLKYGIRMLVKSPIVSSVSILSLALGITASATMFAMFNAWMFAPLPYPDQDELVFLWDVSRSMSEIQQSPGISAAALEDYREAATGLEGIAAYAIQPANMTGTDRPEQLTVAEATPSVFRVLGVSPSLGRGFRPEEGTPGAGNVLVLHHDYWQTRFFGDREILGSPIRLDGQQYTVIGVLPEGFDMLPANIQAIRPTDLSDRREARDDRSLMAMARLRTGASIQQVQTELDAVSTRLQGQFPETNEGWSVTVQRAREFFPGDTDRRLVMLLTAVALFGLLIACANVANLLLGRAEIRQREVAVRTALGAGRGRILRQLLTESVLLGLLAGGLGTLLALFAIRALIFAIPPELPDALVPSLNIPVLLATLLASIGAGVVFGVVPAIHASRGDLRAGLGEGARGGTAGKQRRRLRNAFVIGEMAVALAVLVGASFVIKGFDEVLDVEPGYDETGFLTFQITLSEDRYPQHEELSAFHTEAVQILRGTSGIDDVAVTTVLPRTSATPSTTFTIDGEPVPPLTERPRTDWQAIYPGYFEALKAAPVGGRMLTESDREDAPLVVVVNQAWVDRFFPDEEVVGKRITVLDESREVVGVAGNILMRRMSGLGSNSPAIYLPLAQQPQRTANYMVRAAAGDPAQLAGDVRAAVWSIDPDQPVAHMVTLADHVDNSLSGPRALSMFLAAVGSIALALSAIGIYGVMAHSVTQRTKEIGIRMAVGAERRQVVGMVTRDGLMLAAVGMLAGAPLAYLMYRAVLAVLTGIEEIVSPTHALAVAGALGLVAVLASYLPARGAARVQPTRALQSE